MGLVLNVVLHKNIKKPRVKRLDQIYSRLSIPPGDNPCADIHHKQVPSSIAYSQLQRDGDLKLHEFRYICPTKGWKSAQFLTVRGGHILTVRGGCGRHGRRADKPKEGVGTLF